MCRYFFEEMLGFMFTGTAKYHHEAGFFEKSR